MELVNWEKRKKSQEKEIERDINQNKLTSISWEDKSANLEQANGEFGLPQLNFLIQLQKHNRSMQLENR